MCIWENAEAKSWKTVHPNMKLCWAQGDRVWRVWVCEGLGKAPIIPSLIQQNSPSHLLGLPTFCLTSPTAPPWPKPSLPSSIIFLYHLSEMESFWCCHLPLNDSSLPTKLSSNFYYITQNPLGSWFYRSFWQSVSPPPQVSKQPVTWAILCSEFPSCVMDRCSLVHLSLSAV